MSLTFLSIITPKNLIVEKEKFFSSKTYNPNFEYNDLQAEINEYLLKHKSKSALVNAIYSQDHDEIVHEAQTFFETNIDETSLLQAKNFIKIIPKPQTTVSTDEAIIGFTNAIKQLNIDYTVEVDDRTGFSFRPQHLKKKLVISRDFQTQYASLDSSIKHEVTHIIRYINWKHNNLKRPYNFLPTEEGLASFMGDFHSADGDGAYFQHAAEYVATEISLKDSFRRVYDFFKSLNYSDDTAWQKTVRHKLGFKDTSKPGDIMKPAMYFYHEQKFKGLNREDLLKYFIGKVTPKEVKDIQDYLGKIDKEKIVNFFQL